MASVVKKRASLGSSELLDVFQMMRSSRVHKNPKYAPVNKIIKLVLNDSRYNV